MAWRGPSNRPWRRKSMGLASMRERIEALGGTFTAGPRAGVGGWRVFATVPKQQGDED